MTIQEYDAKASIRKTIDDIDAVLCDLQSLKDGTSVIQFKGIGPAFFCGCIVVHGINDEKIIEDFRQSIIRRKKELIEEFVGEKEPGRLFTCHTSVRGFEKGKVYRLVYGEENGVQGLDPAFINKYFSPIVGDITNNLNI